MPSSTNSFKSQVKTLNQKIRVRESGKSMLKFLDYDPYYTDVTCSFASFSDVICIQINHNALHSLGSNVNIVSYAFNDLKVVDLANNVELPHYVQSYKTDYTCIMIKRLSNTGNTTIRLYHGNVGKISQSDISQFIPQHTRLQAWHRADKYDNFRNYLNVNNDPVLFWQNEAKKLNPCFFKTPNSIVSPSVKINQVGALPSILVANARINSTSKIEVQDEITIAIVVKAGSLQGYQSIVRLQDTGYIVPCWGVNAEVRLSNDDGLPYLSSGAVAGQWNILILRWQKNTPNGFNTYRNGNLVAQRNSSNTALPSNLLHIGALNNNTEFSNADLAEVMIYDKYLSDTERQNLEKYLNAKWMVYGSQPTFTINPWQNNPTLPVDDLTITPASNWNITSKIGNNLTGVVLSEGELNYSQQQIKSIATCSPIESWYNGGSLSPNKELGEYTRQVFVAYGVPLSASVGVDINLTVFNNGIISTMDDYIEISLILPGITGIDYNNCGINLVDINSNSIAGLFTSNVSTLNNGLNVLKIRKSNFTIGATTIFDWSKVNAFTLILSVDTTWQSDNVLFGQIKLTQNITDNKHLQLGQDVVLELTVSDDGTTDYTARTNILKIVEKKRELESLRLNLQNILLYCKENNVRFGDLPSFGDGDYAGKNYLKDQNLAPLVHLKKLEFLIGFIFPRFAFTTLVGADVEIVNRTMPLTGLSVTDVLIRRDELVYNTIDQAFNDCLYTLVQRKNTNNTNNVITPSKRALAYATSDNFTPPYIIDDNLIYNYGVSSSDSSHIINQFKFDFCFYGQKYAGQGVLFSEEFELLPNNNTSIFIDIDKNEDLKNRKRKLLSNPIVTNWQATADQGTTNYNNTGLDIVSVSILDSKTAVVVIRNTNTTTRWLKQIEIRCNYVDGAANYITNTIGGLALNVLAPCVLDGGSLYLKNKDSIANYGVKEQIISSEYPHLIPFNSTSIAEFGVDIAMIRALDVLSNPPTIHEIEMQYVEDIHPSTLVEFKNENGKKVIGVVQEVDWYIPNIKVKIREI